MACFWQFHSHLMLHLFWAHLRRFSGSPFVAISKELSHTPLCVNLQILRTLQSPVCLFVSVWLINLQRFMISQLGQFAENYGETFATIYRDFIDHSLFCNGRFTTTMYKYSKRITRILWKSKGYMSYRDFVNLQIYGSPLIQFRKIYNPPFRSMYRKLWCPICY